ncbi:MAG TPA: sporulation protein YunB [Clostridiaceae bacterium]|nr:sporulation protein YunB [Clostridiaceae bacterium]
MIELRNTMIYRRLRYVRKYKKPRIPRVSRRESRARTYIRFLAGIILFVIAVKYAEKTVLPYMANVSEYRARAVINVIINDVIQNAFSSGTSYNELVTISKNEYGEIEAITTNTREINILSSRIATDIQKKLNSKDKIFVKVPLGSLLGKTILYNTGPGIYFYITQNGAVETNFISEFTDAGINQTKHRLLLEIKTDILIKTAFIKNTCNIITTVPIAETIIVGKVPAIYYKSDRDK